MGKPMPVTQADDPHKAPWELVDTVWPSGAQRSHTVRDKSTVKPIETEWHGCRFRSRLEARWAVFFEALCIDWDYEDEGYDAGGTTRYLPDFVLHGVTGRNGYIAPTDENKRLYSASPLDRFGGVPGDLYIEVKGHMTEDDMHKVKEFAKHRPIYIVGRIPYRGEDEAYWYESMENACYDWPYPYNFETVDGDHFGAFLGVDTNGNPELFGDDSNYMDDSYDAAIVNALRAAKQARFEHGEKPEDNRHFRAARNAVSKAKRDARNRR